MIKVLHYVPGFEFGGIESRLVDWYKNINNKEIQFDVLILTSPANVLLDEIRLLGGNVYVLPKFNFGNLYKFQTELKKFFNTHDDYDIVHCHSSTTGYFILREAAKRNIGTRILHSRTIDFNPSDKNVTLKKLLKKNSSQHATDYFACSKEAGEWVFSSNIIKSDKFKIINNGIEAQRFIFDSDLRNQLRRKYCVEDSFVIGNVARFSTAKNHEFLIDIFVEVLKRHPKTKLMLVGDGPTESDIKQKVIRCKVEDKVIFLGRQSNVEEFYQIMDVFVMPSHFEGFGTAAIEAQSAGLHCIVSDGVPNSVDITKLVLHLPLSIGVDRWADEIIKSANGYKRENTYNQIAGAGFDVASTVRWLEEFYISKVGK